MKSKEQFFKEYNVDQINYDKCGLNWGDLTMIYEDYKRNKGGFATVSSTIAEILRRNEEIHSVKSRVKDPEHLIDKIIRKTIRKHEDGNTEYKITINNYKTEITDIIGIRVLHLYKEQASIIDEMIRTTWELQEKPTIYYRSGDIQSEELNETSEFELKEHPAGYRSWHYLITTQTTKQPTIVEIQVRTIFEEGWSEIDHQLRYPSQLDNQLLNNQLLVLNRLAGNADEMVNTIIETISTIAFINNEKEEQEKIIDNLKSQLENLNKDIDEGKLETINESIRKLEHANSSKINSNINYAMINKLATTALKVSEQIRLNPELYELFYNNKTYKFQNKYKDILK